MQVNSDGGVSAVAKGVDSIAIGPNALASGESSIAQGNGATASGTNAIAMGTNANALGVNSVALGSDSVAERDNTVSVGSAGNERQITNVADATHATDAVNLGQLQGMGNTLNARISDLDGKLSGRIASALALEAAPYIPSKLTYAAGVGYSGGQTALGVSVRKTADNGRWSISGGVAGSAKGGVSGRLTFTGIID
ncbi:trimeric autotransporter adhesin [Hydromonas duriensis]|uniref:Trimeric autotransporter adhesin n=2 Tax=Hydromonas duriensis TaxID=1527608 RepID=A0A4R6Y9B7_9BURK|nr:trimeric autotransporter adhesin [Hydromonas duriensis]